MGVENATEATHAARSDASECLLAVLPKPDAAVPPNPTE